MTQALADDVRSVAPRRISDRVAAPADYAAAFALGADVTGLASEDELDWAENQARPAHEATRLDAALIAIAVTVTATVVALTMGLLKLL